MLVLMPFHALLTTWAGSNFGHLDVFRVVKDFIILGLGVYAITLLIKNKSFARRFFDTWLVRLIMLYAVLFVGYGIVSLVTHSVSPSAVLYAWVINLQYLWFFVTVWVIAVHDSWFLEVWAHLLLIPAAIVVGFGLLQRLVLPADFLRHFGYGPDTIKPIETVDQKLAYRRIQSTLRGANPLGVYLILPILAAVAATKRYRVIGGVLLVVSGTVLFFTYSRSAWIGLLAGVATLAWFYIPTKKWRLIAVTAVSVSMLCAAVVTWQLRNNDFVQNTLFHSDETSQASVSSNSARASALMNGLRDVSRNPLGNGPGTAGPESFRNTKSPARIAENYYVQIAQEIGLLGVVLFILINLFLFQGLWFRRHRALPTILMASFVGISLVNLISHAWADDTLGLVWWGFAGIAMSVPAILNVRSKTNASKIKQKT